MVPPDPESLDGIAQLSTIFAQSRFPVVSLEEGSRADDALMVSSELSGPRNLYVKPAVTECPNGSLINCDKSTLRGTP